jgi:hypothetical protein
MVPRLAHGLHPSCQHAGPMPDLPGNAADRSWCRTRAMTATPVGGFFFGRAAIESTIALCRRSLLFASVALGAVLPAGTVWADGSDALLRAMQDTRPLVDIRLRSESVDQTGLTREADAQTLRSRLGFETGKLAGTSLLAEAGLTWPWEERYNSTVNGKSAYPTVADPEYYGLNRLQLTNSSLPGTTLSIGRQRINLDDQRFVGNSGWRQNEQTFDSARIVNTSVPGLTLDLTYLNRVNRVFGPDSPVGRYTGDSYLINAGYDTPAGKLTAFEYLLDFDQAHTDSSETLGMRLAGERGAGTLKIAYDVSYATQRGYSHNPLDYRDDYYIGELTGSFRHYSLGGGVEVLGSDGVKGFATPLATYHRFDGWDDKFLTTPVNGLERKHVTLGWLTGAFLGLDSLAATATYQDFSAARLGAHYGSEIDLQLQGRWRHFTGLLKFADYAADQFATTTRKVWAELDYLW